MTLGTVRWFYASKGFGFLAPEAGPKADKVRPA